MGLLGFYMPPDTGEKVTTCITTMLSMGVYLKTITEIIPPTSEAVPLIGGCEGTRRLQYQPTRAGVYYVLSLMIVCAATVMNAMTLNLYRKGCTSQQDFASPWVKRYILGYMANMLCIRLPADIQIHAAVQAQKRRENKLVTNGGEQSIVHSRSCVELMFEVNEINQHPVHPIK
jgi:hypothetical protein